MKNVLFLSITVTVGCSIWLLAQTPIGADLLIQGGRVIDGSAGGRWNSPLRQAAPYRK